MSFLGAVPGSLKSQQGTRRERLGETWGGGTMYMALQLSLPRVSIHSCATSPDMGDEEENLGDLTRLGVVAGGGCAPVSASAGSGHM